MARKKSTAAPAAAPQSGSTDDLKSSCIDRIDDQLMRTRCATSLVRLCLKAAEGNDDLHGCLTIVRNELIAVSDELDSALSSLARQEVSDV